MPKPLRTTLNQKTLANGAHVLFSAMDLFTRHLLGRREGGGPKGGGPKISRFFFPSPATIFILSSFGGPLVECWWCYSLGPPGLHTTTGPVSVPGFERRQILAHPSSLHLSGPNSRPTAFTLRGATLGAAQVGNGQKAVLVCLLVEFKMSITIFPNDWNPSHRISTGRRSSSAPPLPPLPTLRTPLGLNFLVLAPRINTPSPLLIFQNVAFQLLLFGSLSVEVVVVCAFVAAFAVHCCLWCCFFCFVAAAGVLTFQNVCVAFAASFVALVAGWCC